MTSIRPLVIFAIKKFIAPAPADCVLLLKYSFLICLGIFKYITKNVSNQNVCVEDYIHFSFDN